MIKFVYIANNTNSNSCFMESSIDEELKSKISNEANNIYKQNFPKLQNERKNKERSLGGSFIYIKYKKEIFYLIFTSFSMSEDSVFDFISDMHKNEIWKLIDTKNKNTTFKTNAISKINEIMLKYNEDDTEVTQESSFGDNKVGEVHNEVEAVKSHMKDNIKKVILNIEEANIIEKKSSKIAETSDIFRNLSRDYKNSTWWNSNIFKFVVIGIVVVLALILIWWAFSD